MSDLFSFVRESNRIEGITREPTDAEFDAHVGFINGPLTLGRLREFVQIVAGAPLRDKEGMDVRVGNHIAPRGGANIEKALRGILARASSGDDDPYMVHQAYEHLHPFMDGNGRSGRVLWLWMMQRQSARDPLALGFLHNWYYQSLAALNAALPARVGRDQ